MGIRNAPACMAGDVFYYRSQKRVFGCVTLFRQREYTLMALSEEITKTDRTIRVQDVLESALYTLAWFSAVEMLPPPRLHRLGTIPLSVDYTDRAGLRTDDRGVLLKNVGQRATWNHEFRSFALRDTHVKDVLNGSFVPRTWQ